MSKVTLFLSHFAVELFLVFILALALYTNISIADSSIDKNKSLFFVYLAERPHLNEQLVDAYGVLDVRVARASGGLGDEPVLNKGVLGVNSKNVETPLPTLAGTALLKPNPSTSDGLLPKRDIEVYTVRGGDTVSTIAATFGVSAETILWENNLSSASLIRPGQQLRILPTSGIKHVVQKGENMYQIAQSYDVDLETILEYNEIEIPEHIFPGEEIIIPNGAKRPAPTPARQSYLASLRREDVETVNVDPGFEGGSTGFVWPLPGAQRLSQGYWSRHRAIDVPCRYCDIVATADGVVEASGWLRGYGYMVLINHGNGLKTRYAHASALSVSAGNRVSQGQVIATSGSTGRSTGPHLHFEVIKNGVYLNPLSVVR